MKEYFSIPSYKDAPKGLPCIAFNKLDGSNLRFEWSRKAGWYKFGTRNRLFDHTDPEFGSAIATFISKYGDGIPKILSDEKEYRGVSEAIVYCEFFGKHSFSCFHDWNEPHDVVLFDVNPYRKGIIPPRQFVKHFGHLHIPAVVYEGNFNQEFIQDVKEGKYPVTEGVVAKGVKPGKKAPHGLWFAK